MSEEILNLFDLATRLMPESAAGPPQVMRSTGQTTLGTGGRLVRRT